MNIENRYKVLNNLPLIDEFGKNDILEGNYIRVKHGLIDFKAFPEHFKQLLWYQDVPISKLPQNKLRCVSNHQNGVHKIVAGEDYNIYAYDIGFSVKNNSFEYRVKIHLTTGISSFPLTCFVPLKTKNNE